MLEVMIINTTKIFSTFLQDSFTTRNYIIVPIMSTILYDAQTLLYIPQHLHFNNKKIILKKQNLWGKQQLTHQTHVNQHKKTST